jgi:hypothetical protein
MKTKTQKIGPAMRQILAYLRANGPVVGAVRLRQLAFGRRQTNQCGGAELLQPIYRLCAAGLVTKELAGKAFGNTFCRYRVAE